MSNRKRFYLLFSMFIAAAIFSIEAFAINSRAIRNASEEILYGTEKVSKSLLENLLKEIAKPETNPKISLTRGQETANEVIQKTMGSIENKLKDLDGVSFVDMNCRVNRFLEVLKSELSQEEIKKSCIELSFLLEAIDGRF